MQIPAIILKGKSKATRLSQCAPGVGYNETFFLEICVVDIKGFGFSKISISSSNIPH